MLFLIGLDNVQYEHKTFLCVSDICVIYKDGHCQSCLIQAYKWN